MTFTRTELEHLRNVLTDFAQQMDDDGNDGAFARSPLHPIYMKILTELSRTRAA